MIRDYISAVRVAWRFRDYRPVTISPSKVLKWLRQFPDEQHQALWRLVNSVTFMSEKRMVAEMQKMNDRLLARLAEKNVPANRVVYVSFHEAGSSSAATLNLIRDACLLENRKCKFVDANNVRGLHEVTSKLGSGAIVYVDDFVGSGNQFSEVHEFVAQHVVGSFSEFLLVHTICEEGIGELGRRTGVEPVAVEIHGRGSRPLHEMCTLFSDADRESLRATCLQMHPDFGLGYKRMATMVVFYRNAPNSVPLVLRGNRRQTPLQGILPRTTDLDV